MPLFSVTKEKLAAVAQTNFATEKKLQTLVEKNLGVVFSCRFVASEFPTGAQHSGRIDTLALSEENNPVIIEYKKVESSDLINQSLFYLSWIHDHRGDFEIAVQKELGVKASVDWSAVRVICIAPNYRRYDLHAVKVMGASLELWTYRLFETGTLYLEEIFQRSEGSLEVSGGGKNPVMVAAGKKAAVTRANASYTVEQHLAKGTAALQELALAVSDFMSGLDPSVEVAPRKFYVAYKTSQNLVCMEVQKKRLLLYLKLNPEKTQGPKGIWRDVTNVGHYGTGDLEITVETAQDLEAAKPFLEMAYQRVGG